MQVRHHQIVAQISEYDNSDTPYSILQYASASISIDKQAVDHLSKLIREHELCPLL